MEGHTLNYSVYPKQLKIEIILQEEWTGVI